MGLRHPPRLRIVLIPVWTGTFSLLICYLLGKGNLLRVEEGIEKMGFDAAEFSPKFAYKSANPESWGMMGNAGDTAPVADSKNI